MPRKDIKTYANYRGGLFEQENEPEEGEIVDDFELIVSSDEELSMRQRIRELEAENEEIEQIAVISRSYVDEFNFTKHLYCKEPLRNNLDTNRAARVPTDASSISSTEFVTPKKRKRRKSKERKKKHCQHHHHHNQHQHHQTHHSQQQRHDQQIPQYNEAKAHSHSRKTQCKRRQKIIAKKHAKGHSNRYMYKEIIQDAVSLDSPNSSDSSSSLSDNEVSNKNSISHSRKGDAYNYNSYITRDTLRLAVARNSNDSRWANNKKSCLKDKLLKQELVNNQATNAPNDGNIVDNADDDDVEVIEPEVDIQTVDEDSSEDSMEEKELRLIALKSAVIKKHMARKRRNAEVAYSPTDFDDVLSVGILNNGENKLDDIEVVDLEENDTQHACVIVSPEASPQLMILDDQDDSQQMMDCKPIDMDIANSDSEDATNGTWSKQLVPTIPSFSYASQEFAKHFHYNMYVHEIELPPPPPGVDDYEEAPPPPPYLKAYNTEMQDMELDNEELMEELMADTKSNTLPECTEQETSQPVTITTPIKREENEVDEEEEEEALRALLLSKFQSPKNQKKLQQEVVHTQCIENSSESMNELKPKKPTESILKEAVKRLKIHSQPEKSPIVPQIDVVPINDNSNDNSLQSIDGREENDEQMCFLGPLRKRLIKLKSQSQARTRDEPTSGSEENQQMSAERSEATLQIEPEIENTIPNSDTYTEKETNEEHATLPTCSESDSTTALSTVVDISDITRRLQKLKDEILNATASPKTTDGSIAEELKVDVKEGDDKKTHAMTNNSLEMPNTLANNKEDVDLNESILQRNTPYTKKSFHNNIDNIAQTDIDNKVLVKHKIVKADFDAVKNVTTFKVTISNSPAQRADIDQIKTVIEDSSLKENNANINAKITNLAGTELAKTVVSLKEHPKEVKVTKKSLEVGNENATPKLKTTNSLAPPAVTKALITALPTYPLVRTTKIVKPNKVINTNLDLKRRLTTQTKEATLPPSKSSKTEPSPQVANVADNSRLISSFEQVKHMCKIPQFVISVQNSSGESSEDEWEDYDSLYKPLHDYNDNASPLSLILESPCRTPLRSISPIEAFNKDAGFEEKLDKFLKTVRTTVHTENVVEKTPPKDSTKQIGITNKTPLAVRHLPAAAQSEYRKLIHRMKLLENQRKSTKVTENSTKSGSEANEQTKPSEDTSRVENDASVNANSTVTKTSLVKQVLIRNASNNSTPSEPQTNGAVDSGPPKNHNTNVLRSYENLYVKFGAGIVNNLDKSLRLVEEAKNAKITKLKLENRLKELKAEMEVLQTKHKEEQQKISRIYPSICTTNDIISSLKQKRSKVFNAALTLGKTIKGEEYRLNNDLKKTILTKTKKLAIEIKHVNSLKHQDIANMNTNREQGEDEEKKKDLQDANTKANEGKKTHNDKNPEMKDLPNSLTNNIICAEENNEQDADATTNATIPTTPSGGNTEKLDQDTPKNPEHAHNTKELPPNDMETVTAANEDCEEKPLSSYISPLEHLRNMDSNMDPNGVICPYDLMGNCEDVTCKFVHISPKI